MRIKSRIMSVVICLILAMSPLTVFAAGTSSVAISSENPNVGDTFTVTATATESGNMTVKYNENVLSVVSCNVGGYTTSIGEVDFSGRQGTITFKANAAGQSAIAVSSSNASSSSMVVNVGSAAANPSTAGASEDFDINGKKYTVSERFSAEEIPAGYSQLQLQINGKSLKGISNGQTTMVYLKPVDDIAGAGTFYIYDQTSNSIKDNFYLGRADYYVIPGEPSDTIVTSMSKKTIDVDGRQVEVYTMQGVEEFVYVYGTSSSNVTGWFQYDISEKTVQRANEAFFTASTPDNSSSEGSSSLLDTLKAINIRYIIAAVIFIVIVVIAIIINVILKKRDDKADLIDGDEEYEEIDDKKLDKEEKKREKAARKATKKEEKRRRKEEKYNDLEDEVSIEDEIREEFDDFDIDRGVDESSNPQPSNEQSESDNANVLKVSDVIKSDDEKKSEPDAEDKSDGDNATFWEDEKDIKKAQKKLKKENKKKKNVFGDDELDLSEELQRKIDEQSNKPNGSDSDIIDFNDL